MGRKRLPCPRPNCANPDDCQEHCKCVEGAQCTGHPGLDYCLRGQPSSTRRQAMCGQCQKAREARNVQRKRDKLQQHHPPAPTSNGAIPGEEGKYRRSGNWGHAAADATTTSDSATRSHLTLSLVPNPTAAVKMEYSCGDPPVSPPSPPSASTPVPNDYLKYSCIDLHVPLMKTTPMPAGPTPVPPLLTELEEFPEYELDRLIELTTQPASISDRPPTYACHITTLTLSEDSLGSFEASAAAVSAVLTKDVLANARSVDGYIESVSLQVDPEESRRLCYPVVPHSAGQFMIMTFFAEEQASSTSARNLYQSIASEPKLYPYISVTESKSEEFEVRTMHPAGGSLVLSPCACMLSLTLRTLDDVAALDSLFEEITSWRISEDVRSHTGFIGAQRFVDRENYTYMYANFWSNNGTLRASASGSHYDQYKSFVKSYCREGTNIMGRSFINQFLHAGLQNDIDRVQKEVQIDWGLEFDLELESYLMGVGSVPIGFGVDEGDNEAGESSHVLKGATFN